MSIPENSFAPLLKCPIFVNVLSTTDSWFQVDAPLQTKLFMNRDSLVLGRMIRPALLSSVIHLKKSSLSRSVLPVAMEIGMK